MNYKVIDNKIIVEDLSQFNAQHIFECGQIFTYEKLDNNNYVVYSKDQMAQVEKLQNSYSITCTNTDYFINFFDLNTDYNKIKLDVSKNDLVKKAIEFGYGIRVLKQDLLEVVIGFVISANNNIKRIIKTMSQIREFGTKKQDYFAFPSLEQLSKISCEQFKQMGAGYRSAYLVKLIDQLKTVNLEETKTWSNEKLKSWLLSLMGIGNKVADCILLFGYNLSDYFPVDTWNEKLYIKMFKTCPSRKIMANDFCSYFGKNSGYAQQYLFYYIRSGILTLE